MTASATLMGSSLVPKIAKIEELVRFAWRDQIVITVLGEQHDSERPVEIVLRRWPRP